MLFLLLFFIINVQVSFANNIDLNKIKSGLSIYKKANCMGCHSWNGNGGGGYGAGPSIRVSELNSKELFNIIKCGLPGTGMPYFFKKSYIEESCYDSFLDDYDENYRPIISKKFLNKKQINSLVYFIENELQGRIVTKEYCKSFFRKKTKVCDNLP